MPVDLSNYKKPEGCFKVVTYCGKNNKPAFDQLYSDVTNLLAVAFACNKEVFSVGKAMARVGKIKGFPPKERIAVANNFA